MISIKEFGIIRAIAVLLIILIVCFFMLKVCIIIRDNIILTLDDVRTIVDISEYPETDNPVMESVTIKEYYAVEVKSLDNK